MFYNLAAPSWGEEELDAIKDVSSSGYFTMSANVSSFESAFAKYHDLPFGVMVNSGSSALFLAIKIFNFKENSIPMGKVNFYLRTDGSETDLGRRAGGAGRRAAPAAGPAGRPRHRGAAPAPRGCAWPHGWNGPG